MVTGSRIKAMDDAAKNYYSLLAENRKMHNELQELKGDSQLLHDLWDMNGCKAKNLFVV